MKSKFTLLLAAGLFFTMATQAQERRYEDRRDNGYSNQYQNRDRDGYNNRGDQDRRFDGDRDNFRDEGFYDYRSRLAKEFAEYDRARACGDYEKMWHEKREIRMIFRQIHHNRSYRHFDDNDFYNGQRWF
jgi:hypothetical protein